MALPMMCGGRRRWDGCAMDSLLVFMALAVDAALAAPRSLSDLSGDYITDDMLSRVPRCLPYAIGFYCIMLALNLALGRCCRRLRLGCQIPKACRAGAKKTEAPAVAPKVWKPDVATPGQASLLSGEKDSQPRVQRRVSFAVDSLSGENQCLASPPAPVKAKDGAAGLGEILRDGAIDGNAEGLAKPTGQGSRNRQGPGCRFALARLCWCSCE